jgi:secreted trypsin-like serine protease
MMLKYGYQALTLSALSLGVNAEDDASIRPRVIGGTNVSAGTYPWFARATQGGFARDAYGCGGSLISAEYVLSAAHCIADDMWDGFQIGALCDPFTSGNNCGQAMEYFGVRSSTRHPNYDNDTSYNDFVLVRLNGSSSITPVDIDSANISNGYSNGKGNLWTIGLGNTSTNYYYPVFPDRLKHVELKYVSNQSCCTTYDYSCSEMTSNKMCAADPGQDSCQGDSGGPLYDSSSQKLVGIVSYGVECADPNYPGVYARVGSQMDWIKSVVCNNHSANTLPSWCGSNPAPAPVATPVAAPVTTPVAAPVTAPVSPPILIPSNCSDDCGFTFPLDFFPLDKGCSWLTKNKKKGEYQEGPLLRQT